MNKQALAEAIADAVFDKFQAALDEFTFEFMTEGEVHDKSERIVCALKEIKYEDYVNDPEGELYDEVWHEAADVSHDVINTVLKRYVGDII